MVFISKIEQNAQNYLKWNKLLIEYFFKEENSGKEVILYADPNLISEIGQENGLGNYDDFMRTIVVDYEYRTGVYDKMSSIPRRGDTEINKSIKKSLCNFPNVLSQIRSRYDLSFFNYIIFFICTYVNHDTSSFYKSLNSSIRRFLPREKNVSSLSGLDDLFEILETWSIKKGYGIFRARRISEYNYVGLLNYQVVLKPELNNYLERILYEYGVTIEDNATYPEFANKILPYVDNVKLRKKLIEAIGSPIYAEWFLNRALAFDHKHYAQSFQGKQIKVSRKGKLTFKIRLEDLSLVLVSDTLLSVEDNPIDFKLPHSGLDNYGYFIEPIQLLNGAQVSFKQYKLNCASNTLELSTININEVNFFIKTSKGYVLTLLPQKNYDLLIVVKNENRIINKWEQWARNSQNIESSVQITNTENLRNLFGDNYVFYSGANIKKAYYNNEESIIYEIKDTPTLSIKKLGGLKLHKNTYLDVGLPYFKINDSDVDPSQVKVKVFRNSAKDNDVIVDYSEGKFMLVLDEDIVIEDSSYVIVKFNYPGKMEKSFDFMVFRSRLKFISHKDLFRFNPWGENCVNGDITYLQGNWVVNGPRIPLNSYKHPLADLAEDSSFDDNYFIYLLTGIYSLCEDQYLKRKDINKAIDAALIYLDGRGYEISEEKFSRTNLIANLCALGFLNKILEDGKERFQLIPPSLVKIEKAFNGNVKQVFQLLGTRSKYMIQRLIEFCEEESIPIKYKRYDIKQNNSLEKALLPEIIYLDIGTKITKIRDFFNANFNIELHIEDRNHLGDSLNKFIATVDNFESKFLVHKVGLANQPLKDTESTVFPRIVESADLYGVNGQSYHLRFLETSENHFYKVKQLNWAKLYVAQKTQEPVFLMRKQYNSGNYSLSPNTYIPSRYRLPEIVYRSFCSINHGIPKTIKVFLKNAKGVFNVEDQMFMHFDFYKFSDKEGRRPGIIKIMTGSMDANNTQIRYYEDVKYKLKFVLCSLYSNIKSAVIVRDSRGQFIALISNYKDVFVNASLQYIKGVSSKSCKFKEIDVDQEEAVDIVKVHSESETLNQIISKILDNKLKELKFIAPTKHIKFETIKEEIIEVKELI